MPFSTVSDTYPIKLTREKLATAEACPEGLAVFDGIVPEGVLTISDVKTHIGLLSSPLAPYEVWAVNMGLLPPIQHTAGYRGTAMAGYRGTATVGDRGTATAGYRGTATAGYCGTATAGDRGTATAGKHGTATAGYRGTVAAGYHGELRLRWFDSEAKRYRTSTAYVGENGIMANTHYKLDNDGSFFPA